MLYGITVGMINANVSMHKYADLETFACFTNLDIGDSII